MKKLTTSIASIAMFAQIVAFPASAFAGTTTLQISGNGAESNNSTEVSSTNNTIVSQTNNADITNTVNASSSTGNNSASKNTGGDVSVDTGNSKTLISIENTANSNSANVANCNCDADLMVKIDGNGADSKNEAGLELTDKTHVAQSNNGDIVNKVHADSTTGDNKASKNTGGNVEVSTGDSITHVEVTTHANSNVAELGGNGHGGSELSLTIAGNGADSENSIWLALDRDVVLQQYNSSYIGNYVDAYSSSGENKALKNTGGSTSIDTGNAYTGVAVDNAANFNWANIDCDCLTDVNAKVAGNGTESHNDIEAVLSDDQTIYQDNSCGKTLGLFEWDFWHRNCGVNNNVDAYSDTGVNNLKDNTANPGIDPEVMTGDAQTVVGSSNTGNSNTYGTPLTGHNGEFGGLNLNISFDLGDLLAALGVR